MRRQSVALLLVCCLSPLGNGTVLAGEPPSRDIAISVSPDGGGADGRIQAALLIAAPPPRVWSVMLDCARAVRFLPALKGCRVLEVSRDGRSDLREHRSKWLALLPETVSIFRSYYDPPREIRFEKAGGDLRFLQGSWRLEPVGGGRMTKLVYDVRVGVAALILGFIIRSALESDVPKFLAALREEAENGSE